MSDRSIVGNKKDKAVTFQFATYESKSPVYLWWAYREYKSIKKKQTKSLSLIQRGKYPGTEQERLRKDLDSAASALRDTKGA